MANDRPWTKKPRIFEMSGCRQQVQTGRERGNHVEESELVALTRDYVAAVKARFLVIRASRAA